ncbi:unnamed protein product [Lepidochelys olivacea]
MATAATAGEIQDEAICSICLGYLMEPVTVACGHNFCRACLTQYSEEKGTGTRLTCPQCRARFQKREFQINTQLNNIIQKIKQLGLKPGKGQKEDLCERHEERLKRFCEDDGETICWVREKSRDHKSHTVVPIEEAAQGCKDVKSTLSRTENVKLQEPEAISTDLKNVYKISPDMREAPKKFGASVLESSPGAWSGGSGGGASLTVPMWVLER